ncbi:MAG: hypothetical protein IJ350_07075 [Clostridia bacterium]|nr:hypothetical protein [Clostridia bacterium]
MDEYVSPVPERDPELYDYLQAQNDRIAILKMGANLPALFSKAKRSPVVILTTQRYFSMDKEDIKDILTWGQGKHRSLILFDESPIMTDRISITRQLLNEIATMLSERIGGLYHD